MVALNDAERVDEKKQSCIEISALSAIHTFRREYGMQGRVAVGNACLVCTLKLTQQDETNKAVALCDAMQTIEIPQYIKLAATRNAIAALGIVVITTIATMGLLYRVEKRVWYLEPDAITVILIGLLFFYLIFINGQPAPTT